MFIKELAQCPKGKWSRTQLTLIFLTLIALVLIVCEVVGEGEVLTIPVMVAMGFLFLFSLIDRIHTRQLELKVSKDGISIEVNSHEGEKGE